MFFEDSLFEISFELSQTLHRKVPNPHNIPQNWIIISKKVDYLYQTLKINHLRTIYLDHFHPPTRLKIYFPCQVTLTLHIHP